MLRIYGKNNLAICFAKTLDDNARAQIKEVCERAEFADSKIRIMPDVHAGMGCTIGTTMTVKDKVVPAMVGVDIGCGMETVKIAEKEIDLARLDKVIRRFIPSGRDIRKTPHPYSEMSEISLLRCAESVSLRRAEKSIGTLGGGNHFIEVDIDESGALYLVVHSGSRHLGKEVAEYYQNEAYAELCENSKKDIKALISRLTAEGRETEIEARLSELKRNTPKNNIPRDLAYAENELFDDYIHDMRIVQRFASLNRAAMTEVILSEMGLTEVERFTTVHNYIDTSEMVLRKGAVSAKKGEKLLIPINMRDGSLICIGKGNDGWNRSAPHGAGRLMSRGKAFQTLTLEQYKEEMDGIFTTCVNRKTLDESPMAYKSMDEIVQCITPTAKIISRIKPVYNFKAEE